MLSVDCWPCINVAIRNVQRRNDIRKYRTGHWECNLQKKFFFFNLFSSFIDGNRIIKPWLLWQSVLFFRILALSWGWTHVVQFCITIICCQCTSYIIVKFHHNLFSRFAWKRKKRTCIHPHKLSFIIFVGFLIIAIWIIISASFFRTDVTLIKIYDMWWKCTILYSLWLVYMI